MFAEKIRLYDKLINNREGTFPTTFKHMGTQYPQNYSLVLPLWLVLLLNMTEEYN